MCSGVNNCYMFMLVGIRSSGGGVFKVLAWLSVRCATTLSFSFYLESIAMYTDEQISALIDCVEGAGHRDLAMLLRVLTLDFVRFSQLSVLRQGAIECLEGGAVKLNYSSEDFSLIEAHEDKGLLDFLRSSSITQQYDLLGGSGEGSLVFCDREGKVYTLSRARKIVLKCFYRERGSHPVLLNADSPSRIVSLIRERLSYSCLEKAFVEMSKNRICTRGPDFRVEKQPCLMCQSFIQPSSAVIRYKTRSKD